MNKGNQITQRHPIEPEELMAYLDGELPLERAAEAAAHLEHCRDCQSIAADLQGVSRRLMAWQAETRKDTGMPQRIVAALDERGRTEKKSQVEQPGWRGALRMPRLPRWVWGAGIAVATVVVLVVVGVENRSRSSFMPYMRTAATGNENSYPSRANGDQIEQMGKGTVGKLTMQSKDYLYQTKEAEGRSAPPPPPPPGKFAAPMRPMIVRTAGLTLVTKEFEKTRAELEGILKLHAGYVGQLTVSAPANSGRTLTATLRIPSDQLDSALAELKKLGRVENESQSGEEVTQRYVDLQARLANARNTEQQLIDILRNRTGKLSDVLEVEQELDRVRGEIEEMEAERKNLAHQVDFATLNMTLTEEFEKPLQGVPISTLTRIHNAAVEGYTSMVDGLVSVILFLFSVGPTLLLWGAILFFPARAVWRRWRARAA